ncbi:MAG: hypothetical protein CMH68_01985, partial [Nisaea sp.]|nr:hypothetical protein [Nisaea sp.]
LAGIERIIGSSRADLIIGDDGDNVVTAFDIPALPSTIENLQMTGTRDVKAVLNDQPNQVTGNAGANRVESGGGGDTVSGAAADDLIYGNKGADVLYGGGDQDSLFGGQDDDLVYGNRGLDLAYGNKGADRLFGGQDNDTVYGGQAGDLVYGNKADDHIFGNRDNDILFGGQGDDWVDGGSGDDRLQGNRGNDTLAGGGGADRFEFGGQSGHDVVTDFTASEDLLDFAAPVTATTSAAGHLLLVHAGGSVEIVGESLESWSASAGAWLV